MYAEFFGLNHLPFNNTPDSRFFFPTAEHEEALASLIYAVEQRKGFVLLTGEVGAGKTFVARMMLRHFGPRLAFATINHGVRNASDLLRSVCREFELATEPNMSSGQLVHVLQDYLLDQFGRNLPVTLVLDEAQALPFEVFEETRMIGNLEADNAKLLQVVIVGQPELRDRFASREFRHLRQRIFRGFHLQAMSRETTEAYINHRLSVAGWTGQGLFDSEAIEAIYSFSRGLPRVINTLCDSAMLSAYSADLRTIDAAFIDSVIVQMMMSDSKDPAGDDRADKGLDRVIEPAAVAAERELAHVDLGALQVELTKVRWEAASMVSEVARQLVSFEKRLDRTIPAVIQAHATQAVQAHAAKAVDAQAMQVAHGVEQRLEPILHRARTTIENAAALSRELRQGEARGHLLLAGREALTGELRRLLDNLTQAAANATCAERKADEVCRLLTARSERSRRLINGMREMLHRTVTRRGPTGAPPRIVKQVFAPTQPSDRAGTAPGVPDRLQGLLGEARESVGQLRALVRDTTEARLTEYLGDSPTPVAHGPSPTGVGRLLPRP